MTNVQQRMEELIRPIDQQIYMCDDRRDLLMFNCAMLQRVREVFDLLVGEEGRKNMFKDLV
jgi:hypothetical protein|tara:strand:- start:2507 stop:2689 length:183 start_codon:yes stop_codon:yes gene_type:complete